MGDDADEEVASSDEAAGPTESIARTPGKGRTPTERPIEAAAPEEFGLVQA